MFSDMGAWFSSSVDSETKKLWKDQGGHESDFDTADFVFSADNKCPDTLRVFDSRAYAIEHLEVFHPCYISDCVKAGNRTNIVLGRYILPPQDILNDVRKHTKLCWDTPDPQSQPARPNSRNVVIRSPSRPQLPQSRSVPHQPQTSRPDGASRPSASAVHIQPVGATTQQRTSPSSIRQNQRLGESSSIKDARSERRPTQGRDKASASLQHNQEAERGTQRQGDEGRRSVTVQQNQNSAAVRTDLTAGQKRAGNTSVSESSPTKRRTIAQREQTDDCVRGAEHRAFSPRTRNSTQTITTDSHSDQRSSNNKRNPPAEINAPRKGGSATSRSSPRGQRTNQSNGVGGGRGTSQAAVVVAEVHASDSCVLNPGQPENRPGCGVRHWARLSGPTDEGVCHISQLMKVMASELSDFVPWKDGAEVYHRSVH